jgi:hypothetical protein
MSGRALLSRKQVQAERLAPESDRGRMVIATLAAYARPGEAAARARFAQN